MTTIDVTHFSPAALRLLLDVSTFGQSVDWDATEITDREFDAICEFLAGRARK